MGHPADAALRNGSREQLVDDLTVVLGQAEWCSDSRDLMVAIAPFHDAARRIGADVAGVFSEAADRGPQDLRAVVTAFGERRDVTPRAFGFELDEAAGQYRSTL